MALSYRFLFSPVEVLVRFSSVSSPGGQNEVWFSFNMDGPSAVLPPSKAWGKECGAFSSRWINADWGDSKSLAKVGDLMREQKIILFLAEGSRPPDIKKKIAVWEINAKNFTQEYPRIMNINNGETNSQKKHGLILSKLFYDRMRQILMGMCKKIDYNTG